MKTTIDIPDELHRRVKAQSALQGKPIRELTIELYRRWLAETEAGSATQAPEAWLEEWVRLGEEALRGAAPGPTATEILAAGRSRLEGRQPMMTVGANVWVAAYDPHDRFHRDSVAFLSAVLERRISLVAPAIMPLEAACALARRAGRSEVGAVAFDRLQRAPGLRLLPVDPPLLSVATRLGTQVLLRGADALQAAAATAAGGLLISWDAELIERAGAQAPTDWLAQHT